MTYFCVFSDVSLQFAHFVHFSDLLMICVVSDFSSEAGNSCSTTVPERFLDLSFSRPLFHSLLHFNQLLLLERRISSMSDLSRAVQIKM